MNFSQDKGYNFSHLRLSLIALMACMMSIPMGAQSIRNMTFGPCDLHAISYCGALEILEKEGAMVAMERVSGEEGGSIVATLLAIGYSAKEISDIMVYTDFSLFAKTSKSQNSETGSALLSFENDAWKGWLESHIAKKTGSSETTFGELHASREGNSRFDLFIIATSANNETARYSYETHFNMKITDAVLTACKNMSFKRMTEMQGDQKEEIMEVEAIFDDPKYFSGLTVEAFEAGFINSQTLCLRMTLKPDSEGESTVVSQDMRVLYIPLGLNNDGQQLFMFPVGKSELINQGRDAATLFLAGH